MEKLPIDFKNKWVEALRSGKYNQGTGELYNEDTNSYCCLGVGAIICGIPKSSLVHNGYLDDLMQVKTVPEILVSSEAGSIAPKLAAMNDDDKKSFSEIADWVEENL